MDSSLEEEIKRLSGGGGGKQDGQRAFQQQSAPQQHPQQLQPSVGSIQQQQQRLQQQLMQQQQRMQEQQLQAQQQIQQQQLQQQQQPPPPPSLNGGGADAISSLPDPSEMDVGKALPSSRKGKRGSADSSSSAAGKPSAGSQSNQDKKEELKLKEKAVRDAVKTRKLTLMKEGKRLAHIDKELGTLQQQEQVEINALRKSLEVADRELAYIDKDYRRKKEAYDKAKLVLDEKMKDKGAITARLTELVMASEQKREARLNELLASIDVDEQRQKKLQQQQQQKQQTTKQPPKSTAATGKRWHVEGM